MLRIIPSSNASSAAAYYSEGLKREDYYSQGEEVIGRWHGLAAEMLGLSGRIEPEQFAALADNRHPLSGEKLTPRSNSGSDRVPGWDFNFHCPKSLSVLQGFTGDENLVKVFRESVAETMADLERLVATRVRLDGQQEDRVTGSFAWAEFVHFTARPVNGMPDPHLHIHAYVFNATMDPVEARWKAAKIRDIKSEAPFFEAVFHARLARKVTELGYSIRRNRKGWEIVGLPQALLEKFSRRTAMIEAIAEKQGITNAKEKDALGAKTRLGKRKGMTHADLLGSWGARVHDDEKVAIFKTHDEKPKPAKAVTITAEQALNQAESHCFERDSVVKRNWILTEALRFGVGHVLVENIEREMNRRDYIERAVGGDLLCTKGSLMIEEAELIESVRSGRGKLAPIQTGRLRYLREFLSKEQREAVRHILKSNDRVTAIRGIAGSGKTTLMQEVRDQVEMAGLRLFAFAPSAAASRGVLRDESFTGADTVARLLVDLDLQRRVKGNVILIDEAGLLGIRDLARIMSIADGSTRVILCGDTGQHGPISRGDAMRLLENYAGLPIATIREIRRQEKLGYRNAVKALSEGDSKGGFALLDEIGAIVEIENDAVRYRDLASEYFRCRDETGVAPLVVSPTHAEGRLVTNAIREALAERGRLGEEKFFPQFRASKWTEAEKLQAENYAPGMVLQYHQNGKGIKRGSILTVTEAADGNNVWLGLPNGARMLLNWTETEKFQVFEVSQIALARGDLVKITRNGFSDNGRRLSNGNILQVKEIRTDGKLEMANGIVLAKDHGHIEHGYCSTSHSSQGKTVPEVFVAQSAASVLAASKEGFYVSCSRGKQNIRVFTDDRMELQRAIGNSSERLSALEFGGIDKEVFMSEGLDGVEWVKRVAAERARRHEPASHVDKLLAARRVDPLKKSEVMDFRSYIDMRRANVEPDGKSRSKGNGPVEIKQRGRGMTLPKTVELNEGVIAKMRKPVSPQVEPSEQKKPAAKSKVGEKLESIKRGLKTKLDKILPADSFKQGEKRSIGMGNGKVKIETLNGPDAKKQQEKKHVAQQRDAGQEKKVQAAKIQAPVIRKK